MGRKIAIIGTAGRDKNFPMNARHWDFMCNIVKAELEPDDHLIPAPISYGQALAETKESIGRFKDFLAKPIE